MNTKIPQMGYVPREAFSQNRPFFCDSMKTSQPVHDGFGANIDMFPKETIESKHRKDSKK
jgi:hypothetical protein